MPEEPMLPEELSGAEVASLALGAEAVMPAPLPELEPKPAPERPPVRIAEPEVYRSSDVAGRLLAWASSASGAKALLADVALGLFVAVLIALIVLFSSTAGQSFIYQAF